MAKNNSIHMSPQLLLLAVVGVSLVSGQSSNFLDGRLSTTFTPAQVAKLNTGGVIPVRVRLLCDSSTVMFPDKTGSALGSDKDFYEIPFTDTDLKSKLDCLTNNPPGTRVATCVSQCSIEVVQIIPGESPRVVLTQDVTDKLVYNKANSSYDVGNV